MARPKAKTVGQGLEVKKVTKTTPRRGSKAPTIIDIATKHPDLGPTEIAKMADCSHVNVITTLQRYGINQNAVEGYKNHRAEILAGMQEKILNTITEQDIKGVPLNLRVLSYGILYDKERLERGQSTDNQSVIVTHIRDLQSRLRGDDVNRD